MVIKKRTSALFDKIYLPKETNEKKSSRPFCFWTCLFLLYIF